MSKIGTWSGSECYLWFLGNVLGTVANETDRFHARVGEASVASELGQTLYRVLKRVDDGEEVLVEQRRCNNNKCCTSLVCWIRTQARNVLSAGALHMNIFRDVKGTP